MGSGSKMTPTERTLCWQLTIMPDTGTSEISEEEFLRRFPSAVQNGKLALNLLNDAVASRSADDLSCALTIGGRFGLGPEHVPLLVSVVNVDWHTSHEAVVELLDPLRALSAIDAFYGATQWIPGYLNYDDARALAVKAIWALGNLNSPAADAKLELLASADDQVLRKNAIEQLERRRGAR